MFKFKGTNLFYILLLALTFVVVSCDEDQIQEDITPNTPPTEVQGLLNTAMGRALPPPNNASADSLCFTFNFPLGLILEDGTTITANDEDELNDAFLTAEDSDNLVADFEYPLTLTLADGTETTVDEFEALLEVLISCFGDFEDWDDEDWDDYDHGDCPDDFDFEEECFTIVFPLTVMVNDENITVEDEDAFEELLSSFDGDTISEFDLVFPFSLFVLADSTIVEIASEEDLEAVIETCDFDGWDDDDDDDDDDYDDGDEDDWDINEGYGCFEIVFPFNLSVNGESITINSEEDFGTLFIELGDEELLDIELEYPVTVTIFSDSSTVVINNEEEWEALCDACHFDGENGDFDDECFTVNYPLEVILAGENVTVESEEALLEFFANSNPEDFEGFAFPFTVTVTETGEVVSVNSEEELAELTQYCE